MSNLDTLINQLARSLGLPEAKCREMLEQAARSALEEERMSALSRVFPKDEVSIPGDAVRGVGAQCKLPPG